MREEQINNTIQVITFEDEGLNRGPRDLITASLDVGRLRTHLRTLVEQLHELVDWEPKPQSNFRLQEVEFSVEITAEGEFKLVGVGTTAGLKGGIKFVLKRESAQPQSTARVTS